MSGDRDGQTAWQARACAVLADLLEQAARDGLPVLWWTIDGAGCGLVGRSLSRPSQARRGELQAWADALGITLHEHKHRDGGTGITGSDKQRETSHGFCTIALTADIYQDEEDEAGG